jgi:hypothetical protein
MIPEPFHDSLPKKEHWAREHFVILFALGFDFFANLGDILCSRLRTPGFLESNPYARDIFGNFIWTHQVVYDATWFILAFAVFGVAYLSIRKYSEFVAQWVFAFYFIWDGFRAAGAVIHNFFIWMGWYVPSL